MKDRLVYQIVCAVSFVLSLLPFRVIFWLAKQAGNLCYFLMPKRRKIALDNIRAALGENLSKRQQRHLARTSFQNISLSLVELFMIDKIRKESARLFQWRGRENFEHAFAQGRGLILTVSHAGSWELLGILPYLTPHPVSVVVKEIRNPYLNHRINNLRRKMNLVPIPKQGSAREVLKRLKNNECVGVLLDQWAGGEGAWLDFFNRPTSTTTIPARLAKKTGCLLVPAYCLRNPKGSYTIQVEPAVELPNADVPDWENVVTQRLSDLLERQIRANPEQWIWTHRRWKAKPQTLRE